VSRFDAIRSERTRPATVSEEAPASAVGRTGKKAVSAYFSREMSRALHLLALEQDASLQALMGEAFDDLLRKYGKHPFGER
jgi:hypothetical protein